MSVSDARFFDHDPFTGATEYFHWDPETEGFTMQTQQDLTALVEMNTELWNDNEKHTRYKDGIGGRVAQIPAVIMMELSKAGILSPAGAILDEKRFRAWLNDSDNRAFRTRPGTV